MKAIIIEDEPLIAKELQYKIGQVAPDVQVLEHLTSLKTARKWLMNHAEPDLMFMDIQLGDGMSFELFEEFSLQCPVIFTTAFDEYAIRAFKVNGFDYLLKPVDEGELRRSLDRCRSLMQGKQPPTGALAELARLLQQPAQAPLYKEKFIVNTRNQWVPVRTADIACFLRDQLNYLHTFSGERYLMDYNTLEEIEELLDPQVFYRANRQCIIHVDAIQSVRPHDNQKLTVHLKAPLKMEVDISREKAPGFKKWLDR
ncbi:MAG TPA: LytTR family DNA-binding domain-containing protein [Saprospiraceae bacterium]|nr:LytTR family DNA-binding domain-containing protein [Saprospiraceae bacterium]HND89560.1 LytTR family DNA-binding domain-containing protein [Saprospiraceae bacterium]HNG89071.1 LytTR family DNA-binding domain-containing protein [Saprospiraceae bacterium]